MRRTLARELDDPLGQVGLDRVDPGADERVVQAELVRRERLHLHDLPRADAADEADHDPVRLVGVAGPVHDAARRRDSFLEL